MESITSYKEAFPDLAQADDELKGVAQMGELGKKVLNNETLGPSDEKEAADRMVQLLKKWYAERKDAAASRPEYYKEAEVPLYKAGDSITDSPKPLGSMGDITINELVHKMGQ